MNIQIKTNEFNTWARSMDWQREQILDLQEHDMSHEGIVYKRSKSKCGRFTISYAEWVTVEADGSFEVSPDGDPRGVLLLGNVHGWFSSFFRR